MTDQPDDDTDENRGRGTGTGKLKGIVLLRANRLVLAGTLAVLVFVTFVGIVDNLEPPIVPELQDSDMIDTMFSTMIGVILTGTTLVVTIGQLILTQETGPLGDQRDRMDNAMEFRSATSDLTGQPSPTDPAEFLQQLVDVILTQSEELRDTFEGSPDLDSEIDTFVGEVVETARPVSERLDGAEFGSFHLLSAAMNFNYGWNIARIERLQTEYGDQLDDHANDRLEDMKTAFKMFGPAREHIKTLYFQWELINLSQMILYAAIPSVVVAGVMVTIVTPETVSGTLFGIERITLLVGGAFTVTLLPFLLFVSYIVRILTVAKHTLAMEPLILGD